MTPKELIDFTSAFIRLETLCFAHHTFQVPVCNLPTSLTLLRLGPRLQISLARVQYKVIKKRVVLLHTDCQ